MQGSLAYRLLLKKSKTNSEYKNGTFTLNAFSRWLSLCIFMCNLFSLELYLHILNLPF